MKTFNKISIIVLFFVILFGISGAAKAATATVNLGSADIFAILAGSGITNTGATTIAGDAGSSAIDTQTGFGTVTFSSGANHTTVNPNDATTQTAKVDLATAYTDAAGRTPATPIVGGELGGRTLTPGAYKDNDDPDALALTGTLTLDAQGNTDAVFIFQSGSTLTTASGSRISLINGAMSCNIFWQITSSATLGTTTDFKGNILALTSITLNTGATVNGRVLARNGEVTLDANTITATTCAASLSEATTAAATYNTAKAAAAAKAAADAAAAAAARLPSTGVAPTNSNVPLAVAIVASVLVLSTLFVVIQRKKRAI